MAGPLAGAEVEAAIVRHGLTLNLNSTIQGSVRQLLGENASLNTAQITGAFMVPGTPTVLVNGTPIFGGTVQGTGSTTPTGYTVSINNGMHLGLLVTRTDPVPMPTVSAPPAPTGTRDVTITAAGQSIGDATTLRNLTLNGTFPNVAVPPGTYGAFSASGSCGFIFGVAGSTQPAIYNLTSLSLNASCTLQVVGR